MYSERHQVDIIEVYEFKMVAKMAAKRDAFKNDQYLCSMFSLSSVLC